MAHVARCHGVLGVARLQRPGLYELCGAPNALMQLAPRGRPSAPADPTRLPAGWWRRTGGQHALLLADDRLMDGPLVAVTHPDIAVCHLADDHEAFVLAGRGAREVLASPWVAAVDTSMAVAEADDHAVLVVATGDADEAWLALLAAGRDYQITPVGQGVAALLRVGRRTRRRCSSTVIDA